MKAKKILCAALALTMSITAFTACGSKETPNTNTNTNTPATTDTPAAGTDTPAAGTDVDDPTSTAEHYTFSHYFNYDWWALPQWGVDETSKYYAEKFNLSVEISKPDADAASKLNLMISADELPDSIMMDRGVDNAKLARLGLLQPLDQYQQYNSDYDDNVLASTQELLKIDGKLYGIPNWSRKQASGGNDVWMYNQRLYEAVGSPTITTFEDLYAYAKAVKDTSPTNAEGLPVIPFATDFQQNGGDRIVNSFYRSRGNLVDGWYGSIDGKYQLLFRDPRHKDAAMEANKWFREGLISEANFTETNEQFVEKMVAGRIALAFYDQSKDDENHFRSILRESHPGDSYEVIYTAPDNLYPPANGLTPDKIYADYQATVGWNVTCITTKAEKPQRIFDLWTHFLTREGSITMMYGPKGGDLWDELDADGNPILKMAESDLTAADKDRLGVWTWNIPGQSDNVDNTKFAVNAAQPAEKRSWVISNQSDIISPLMFLTDEFVGVRDTIDGQSDEGIKVKLCEDYIVANLPKAIMASSAEKASQIYDDILKFCLDNGIDQIEEIYNVKYKANCDMQGGSRFTK